MPSMVALTNTMSKNIENAHKHDIPYYKLMLHFFKKHNTKTCSRTKNHIFARVIVVTEYLKDL